MKKVELVVTNKWTYLCLLVIPAGIIKIIYDVSMTFGKAGNQDIQLFAYKLFGTLIVIILGVGLFFKFNMYSHWMNPDHPKTNPSKETSSTNKATPKS